jgi:hypothetical protein
MTQSSTAGSAPGLVTLDSVRASLLAAIGSGRIGEPVNVRLHWQTGNSTTDLTETAIVAASLADAVLSLTNPVWRVRTGTGGQLLHLLARDDRGRTALISICTGDTPTLAVTVYGNHGVVRLEDSPVNEQVRQEHANEAWGASLKQAIQAASV